MTFYGVTRSPWIFINETAVRQDARPECAWMSSISSLIDVCGVAEVGTGGRTKKPHAVAYNFFFTVCASDYISPQVSFGTQVT